MPNALLENKSYSTILIVKITIYNIIYEFY